MPQDFAAEAKRLREEIKRSTDPKFRALREALDMGEPISDRAIVDAAYQQGGWTPEQIAENFETKGFWPGVGRGLTSDLTAGFYGNDQPMSGDRATVVGELVGNLIPTAFISAIPGGQAVGAARAVSKLGKLYQLYSKLAPYKKAATLFDTVGEGPRAWNETRKFASTQDVPGTHENVAGGAVGAGQALAQYSTKLPVRAAGMLGQLLGSVYGTGIDTLEKAGAVVKEAPWQAGTMAATGAIPIAADVFRTKATKQAAALQDALKQSDLDMMGGQRGAATQARTPRGMAPEPPQDLGAPHTPKYDTATRQIVEMLESEAEGRSPNSVVHDIAAVGDVPVRMTDSVRDSAGTLRVNVGGKKIPLERIRETTAATLHIPTPSGTVGVRSQPGDIWGSKSLAPMDLDGDTRVTMVPSFREVEGGAYVSDNVISWIVGSDKKPIPGSMKVYSDVDVSEHPTVKRWREAQQKPDYSEVSPQSFPDVDPSPERIAAAKGITEQRATALKAALGEATQQQQTTGAQLQEAVESGNMAEIKRLSDLAKEQRATIERLEAQLAQGAKFAGAKQQELEFGSQGDVWTGRLFR